MIDNKDESVGQQEPAAKAKKPERKNFTANKEVNKTESKESVAGEKKATYSSKPKANSSKDFKSIQENIEKKIDDFLEANKDAGLRKLVSATKLMEAGAHIGMSAKFWNPKMKPFIRPKHGGKVQIIDILKTIVFMDRAYNFLKEITIQGGSVLLVGTHGDIIKNHVAEEAKRVKCYYVNQRWLGGTLTNFKTINKSIDKLNHLISLQLTDEIKKYSKKEQLLMNKEIDKMSRFLGGIRTMRGLPQAIVVTDPVHEHNAVMEAKKLHIPVVAFANTNANPDLIDFIIPCNSSSIKTIWLLISVMCDAIAEASGAPLSVVGKANEEIVLPEIVKKEPAQGFIQHRRFTRGNFVKPEQNKDKVQK